jgi:hypothetical protein
MLTYQQSVLLVSLKRFMLVFQENVMQVHISEECATVTPAEYMLESQNIVHNADVHFKHLFFKNSNTQMTSVRSQ